MDRLALLDRLFYKAQQYDVASFIMSGVTVLSPAAAGDRLEAGAIAGHLAARLERIRLLRLKFVQDPLRLGGVFRVEDPEFDIFDHIETVSLPDPGDYQALMRCVGELIERPLTLKQLWRWVVIDGLAGGEVAIFSTLHHALADGVGASEALMAIHDRSPVRPETARGRRGEAPAPPQAATLLRKALVDAAQRWSVRVPGFAFKQAGKAVTGVFDRSPDTHSTLSESAETPAVNVKPTSLNTRPASPKRAVAYRSLPRAEIKALARKFDCTVNDIGLLLYSVALEHYFSAIGESVDFDLYCGMPLSTRTDSSQEGGNQATMGVINLHNTIPEILERLQAIHRDTGEIKRLRRPEKPVFDVAEVGELLPPSLLDAILLLESRLGLVRRLSTYKPTINVALSNVPGPAEPLYVANGRVVENVPLIPLLDLIGMSGGISSSAENITFGFHCFADIVRNPELLVQGVDAGMEGLRKANRRRTTRRGKGGTSRNR